MSTPPMAEITLGYSYGQEEPIEHHLEQAGYKPVWHRGKPTPKNPEGNILKIGEIEEFGIRLIKIRSGKVPRRVSEGAFDLGFVGTDVFLDHELPNIKIASDFDHGRDKDEGSPYLELVAHANSPINSLKDITPGTIVMTERPHLTKQYLTERGFKTILYWNTRPKDEFKRRLVEAGKVGIEIIEGGGGQQIMEDELLALVTESGQTRIDYDLKHIAKICDIDTLLLVNNNSLLDPEKKDTIRDLVLRLDNVYRPIESEGIGYPTESLVSPRSRRERY